jgi:hypothetical protein
VALAVAGVLHKATAAETTLAAGDGTGGDEPYATTGVSRRSMLVRTAGGITGFVFSSVVLGRMSPAHACPDECHLGDCCSFYYCKTAYCEPATICFDGDEYEHCIDLCSGNGNTCGDWYFEYTGESC